ncbi:MAG: hypothetical protein M3328_10190, partial [Chloroflexota bacterium]|nr:hypothetical protein [Chloroflexota bacterium]
MNPPAPRETIQYVLAYTRYSYCGRRHNERSTGMSQTNRERNEQMGGLAGLGAGVIAGAQVGT